MRTIKIEKLNTYEIPSSAMVKVTEMGNITEHLYLQKRNMKMSIRKLDKERYLNLETGEIGYFKNSENRTGNLDSLRRTMRQLRQVLNTNITDVKKCRWLTLTYAENMTDHTKIKGHFMNFNARLRKLYGEYEYIAVREPQKRGAWHLHVVLIFKEDAPFIPNEIVSKCWKKGFVTIKRLDDVDNVGAYLTAYLCDMDINEVPADQLLRKDLNVKEIEIRGENNEVIKKRYIKGARLNMYPVGMNLFTCSKGLEKPEIAYYSHEEATKKVSSAKLTYESVLHLVDVETGFDNILVRKYYNAIRK